MLSETCHSRMSARTSVTHPAPAIAADRCVHEMGAVEREKVGIGDLAAIPLLNIRSIEQIGRKRLAAPRFEKAASQSLDVQRAPFLPTVVWSPQPGHHRQSYSSRTTICREPSHRLADGSILERDLLAHMFAPQAKALDTIFDKVRGRAEMLRDRCRRCALRHR